MKATATLKHKMLKLVFLSILILYAVPVSFNFEVKPVHAAVVPFSQLNPTDDAYVRSDAPSANFGSDPLLVVDGDGGTYFHSYLKFNLSSVLPSGAIITDAKLCLYLDGLGCDHGTVYCYAVTDDSWDEDTITWDNKPATGDLLDSTDVYGGLLDIHKYYSWNVTGFVAAEWAGDGVVSFCMTPSATLINANFQSKDDSRPPYLQITFMSLNLRIKDRAGNIISGATVYADTTPKVSDAKGWANFTAELGTVAEVKVKYQDVWVNGTFTVTIDSSKTIDVICNVYSLTVKVEYDTGDPVADCPLELYRDGTLLNGKYGLPESPKTNSSGYYVWSQLANQSASYTIRSPWAGIPEVSTNLTEDTVVTITVATEKPAPSPAPAPPPAPPPTPRPSIPQVQPEQVAETFRKVPVLLFVPPIILIVVYALVVWRLKP